mgnify:FL=1
MNRQRRNRRAGVEDRWHRADGSPSASFQIGKRWRARYVDNRSKEHTRAFSRKSDAQRWLDEVVTTQVTGTYIDPALGSELFETVAEKWFSTKATRKPKTVAGYRSLLDTHVLRRWSGVRLSDIHHEDVQDWVNSLSAPGAGFRHRDRALSPSRAIQAYQILNQVLKYAIRSRRLASNPAADVDLPRKSETRKRFLTHRQVHQLASQTERFETLTLVLAYCGLRFGEAAGLEVGDLDLSAARIRVRQSATAVTGRGIVVGPTKNHTARSVPVPAFLVDMLTGHIVGSAPGDLVFPSRKGGYLPLGEYRWAFDKGAAAIGIDDLIPHELRHTAASLAIQSGANVKVIQRMLGHKSATLTFDLYGHLYPDDLDDVANALDASGRQFLKSTTDRPR